MEDITEPKKRFSITFMKREGPKCHSWNTNKTLKVHLSLIPNLNITRTFQRANANSNLFLSLIAIEIAVLRTQPYPPS